MLGLDDGAAPGGRGAGETVRAAGGFGERACEGGALRAATEAVPAGSTGVDRAGSAGGGARGADGACVAEAAASVMGTTPPAVTSGVVAGAGSCRNDVRQRPMSKVAASKPHTASPTPLRR